MNEYATPHPEAWIAKRIRELECLAPPDVMVWRPASSASGNWEAMGDGWTIVEESPSAFCDALEARLAGS